MLMVKNARCEYMKNPIGIGVMKPRISWQLEADLRSTLQIAYRIQVSVSSSFLSEYIWDSGKIESEASTHIEYGGPQLKSRQRYYYRIKVWDNHDNESVWSSIGYWEMGILSIDEWKADWITPMDDPGVLSSGPSPMFRKEFKVSGKVKAARIYVTSLGLYELKLNGLKVSDALFTPGWTSYSKRLQYQTYDITDQLSDCRNVLGVVLGDGWYRGNMAWRGRKCYGDKLALLLKLVINYEDGREEEIISDSSWITSTGPILMSDHQMGETYDARLEKDGWDTPYYSEDGWKPVEILEHTKEILIAQENVPVKIINELTPIGIIITPKGEKLLDMGQNMVGWVQFRITAERGRVVTLEHAEVLDKEGNFYTDNLRSARQTIQYTVKGGGTEIYEPHFTFQGFRYVRLIGFPENTVCSDFTGKVIHSAMEETGSFKCSDEMINKLQHNILWGQKGNFLDVPTDCPQRNERLGWTGDAQVFMSTACFNMNVANFFIKWLRDLKADQTREKGVPFVIPHVIEDTSFSSAAWGDAACICPWTLYLCYGDKRILEEQYESMKDWILYIKTQGENEFLWNTGFHFGDWLGLDSKDGEYTGATAKDYIATAFYAYSTWILMNSAEILCREEDYLFFKELYSKIIYNYRKEFVTPNGRLSVPTQTAHILALKFGLLEDKDRERAAKTLVELLEVNRNHLTTGFVGTPYLCEVLSDSGHIDIAYELLFKKDYPSWLYQITKGATTIWEHWDGIKEDGSFWSKDMNSFNHYAYGAIGNWMYRIIAGLDLDTASPGYKHFYIRPRPNKSLSFAEAKLQTNYGLIKITWKIEKEIMNVNISVPANTTASVKLPGAEAKNVTEGEISLYEVGGVTEVEQIKNDTVFELGSGEYNFKYMIV